MLLSRALLALGAVGGAVAAATGQERCNQVGTRDPDQILVMRWTCRGIAPRKK